MAKAKKKLTMAQLQDAWSRGGKARWEGVNKADRSKAARKAVMARHGRVKQ